MSTTDFDAVVERYHLALDEYVKGNLEPVKMLFSHRDDVTLANPIGPPQRGREQVAAAAQRAASQFSEGESVGFEIVAKYVTPELAYIVEIHRGKARFGASPDIAPFALRLTTIFRPEDGVWKIVHRHADPITTAQPIESIIQK
jgi:ketosteroid isomerase-like protein